MPAPGSLEISKLAVEPGDPLPDVSQPHPAPGLRGIEALAVVNDPQTQMPVGLGQLQGHAGGGSVFDHVVQRFNNDVIQLHFLTGR